MKVLRKIRGSEKGFTLIELLVVIAIIGVLSSIVLASLNTARGKGANAAIKGNLANMRAEAEIFYDGAGNYGAAWAAGSACPASIAAANGTMFADKNIYNMITAAATAAGYNSTTAVKCYVNATAGSHAWAVTAPLKTDEVIGGITMKFWCADSKGNSSGRATDFATGSTDCTN